MKNTNLYLFIFIVFQTLQTAAQTTFNYTGSVQTFTVPHDACLMSVDIKGAGGGPAIAPGKGIGGKGGRVQAMIPVIPGEVLSVYVGGANGWNGGGAGTSQGGVGGDASDIRQGGTSLSNRIVVAGGGAGAGYMFNVNQAGGHGGSLIGANGGETFGGKGGTQTNGGTGGKENLENGTSGNLGTGGNGGNNSAGGGGGGYYGGGGGGSSAAYGGGGGGGSNYIISTATNVIHTQGYQSGNGQIIITPVTAILSPPVIFGDTIACIGIPVSYSIDGVVGAVSYNWKFPTGTTIIEGQGTDSVVVAFGTESGIVEVTAGHDCGATSMPVTLNVTVAAATANAGNDTTICRGDSVQLNTSAPSAIAYSWSPSIGLSNSTISNPWASPETSAIYTVTVTYSDACTVIDEVEVAVFLADAGADVTFCTGDSAQLSASGGLNYSWSPSTGLSDTTISNPWASPDHTITYTIIVEDANGCTASDTVKVFVASTLIADAGPDTAICEGESVQLMATGGAEYTWSPGSGLTCINCQNPIASPSETVQYIVTVSSGFCAPATDSVMVSVFHKPIADFNYDITGTALHFTNVSSNADSYEWIFGDGNTSSEINPVHEYEESGSYEVCLTVENECGKDTHCDLIQLTSIAQLSNKPEVKIYPNPANHYLIIEISGTASSIGLELKMFSVEGKQIDLEAEIIRGDDSMQVKVMVNGLAAGFYMIQIAGNDYFITEKVYVFD